MACSLDFIEFVCEQIAPVGDIRYRSNFRCRMCYFSDNEAARKNKKFKLQRKINTKCQKKIKKNYLLAKAN